MTANARTELSHQMLKRTGVTFSQSIPNYQACREDGTEYLRPARVIHELPHSLRKPAIDQASRVLGLTVQYGVEVWASNNMKHSDVAQDGRVYLSTRGCDLPLALFWADKPASAKKRG